MFKINDRVRLKNDNNENPALTVRSEVGGQRFLCISDCGQRMVWACDHELELVERNTDLKQAIREVLLSEQFLMEFAKAFASASVPSTVQSWSPITGSASEAYCLQKMERERQAEQSKGFLNSDTIPEGYCKLGDSSIEPRQVGDLYWSVSKRRYVAIVLDHLPYANRDNWAACRKVEPVIKQSLKTEPPDGWRWLEVGEVIRKGDKPRDGRELRLLWVGTPCANNHFILRRNRFEVGEKVVDCRGVEGFFTVQHFDKEHLIVFLDGVPKGIESKHLVPYIEDTK